MINPANRSTPGQIWLKRTSLSRCLILLYPMARFTEIPCWVDAKRLRLYAAEKKQIAPIKSLHHQDSLIKALIIKISLKRLMVKGPAKLSIASRNHIILKKGINLRTPLLFTRLRLWLRSYIILAALNIPDEVTP